MGDGALIGRSCPPTQCQKEEGVDQFAYLLGGMLGHDDDLSKPATPNQFGKRRIDAKCPGCASEIWTIESLPRLTQNRQCTH